MKRMIPLFLIIICLSGCYVKKDSAKECISDEIYPSAVPCFMIEADIPSQAVLTASCHDGCCAMFTHPDFEIFQEVFRAESLEDAFVHLTGKNQDELSVVQIRKSPQNEYRFSFTAASEDGSVGGIGTLIYDGTHGYSMTILCPLEKQSQYEDTFSGMLSSIVLNPV